MAATTTPRTKLVEIEMDESSGVDHPANAPQVGRARWVGWRCHLARLRRRYR